MSYIPSKETWVKTFSVAVAGAGAVTSSIGSRVGSHALGNIGAVANLAGNLLDDVPEAWLKERAKKTYRQMLGLVVPSLQHAYRTDPLSFHNMLFNAEEDRRPVTSCARAVYYFANHAFAYEIARVENFPALIKAVFSSVAFGFSARDAAVGGFGGVGIVVGSLIGLWVSDCTVSSYGERQDPPSPMPQNGPALPPQNGPLPEPEHIGDYLNIEHINPRPSYTVVGDYKGRIAMTRFFGSIVAGASCLVALSVTQTRSRASYHAYMADDFLSTITNAVAAGAAVGELFATLNNRVASRVQRHRRDLASLFAEQQEIAPLDTANPHRRSGWDIFHRGFEHLFMGRVF